MKRFWQTLYGKISIIFLMLIFIFGALEVFISVRSSVNYVCEVYQKSNYHLARDLADRMQPYLTEDLDRQKMMPLIKDLCMMNPRVDIYFLDEEGNILINFDHSNPLVRKRVDMEPVLHFLSKEAYSDFPLKGDDPLFADHGKVFSAAPVMFTDGKLGYIYIILTGTPYDIGSEGILDSYILTTSAFALILTLIIAGGIGLLLFFLITRRLRVVKSAIQDFEKGQYGSRLPVKSGDEIGELAFAYNRMAETIEKNMGELEKNDRLRRDLIANISHDLRSPLASVQGYIETVLIKDEQLSREERRQFMETTLKNVVNLNQLVNELFELSKLDANQSPPKLEAFSLAELTQDVVLKFQPISEQRSVHLITKLPVNLPFVMGDIGMIERVLSNLIDNAIRFTPKNGKVTIKLIRHDDDVQVRIEDTGSGIPGEDLDYIFDRFYRVEKSRSRNSGGSGLGLAIAKKIIKAHQSDITVHSELNVGTIFTFNLKICDDLKRAIRSELINQ